MKNPGPLTLEPILVPKPWGGKRLPRSGKLADADPATTAPYGESWEVADLPDHALSASPTGRTLVAGGPHRGKSLRRLIAELGSTLLGSASPTPAGDFPLLFKLLDTAEYLSIQVHPDRHFASERSDWFAKTESWYVLDAEPGATILKGFRPGVRMEDVRKAAGTPALVGLMQEVPVRRGDFHHIPAGTVHALGAGVTVAEVQTPSDTTFRLYDWADEHQRPIRGLHLSDALEALSLHVPDAVSLPAMAEGGDRLLVRTPYYWIREHRATARPIILQMVPELRVLTLTCGRAMLSSGDDHLRLEPWSTVLMPAQTSECTVVQAIGTASLLEIGL